VNLNFWLERQSRDLQCPESFVGFWNMPNGSKTLFDTRPMKETPLRGLTFRLPVNQIIAEDAITFSIGLGTALTSAETLEIRRIEVTAHVVGYLGVAFDERQGKIVAAQLLEGAGARAGIKPGDQFLSVDGQSVNGMAALMSRLAKLNVGEPVRIDVLRDGKPVVIHAVAD
jgi:S1-C subfamily serine protease